MLSFWGSSFCDERWIDLLLESAGTFNDSPPRVGNMLSLRRERGLATGYSFPLFLKGLCGSPGYEDLQLCPAFGFCLRVIWKLLSSLRLSFPLCRMGLIKQSTELREG